MSITIRNESDESVDIIVKKSTIHEYVFTIEPKKYLDVSLEMFNSIWLDRHVIKLVNGVVKIKGKI